MLLVSKPFCHISRFVLKLVGDAKADQFNISGFKLLTDIKREIYVCFTSLVSFVHQENWLWNGSYYGNSIATHFTPYMEKIGSDLSIELQKSNQLANSSRERTHGTKIDGTWTNIEQIDSMWLHLRRRLDRYSCIKLCLANFLTW